MSEIDDSASVDHLAFSGLDLNLSRRQLPKTVKAPAKAMLELIFLGAFLKKCG